MTINSQRYGKINIAGHICFKNNLEGKNMSKSSGILRICEEKGIKMIDFKMTDLSGRWRHITIPV